MSCFNGLKHRQAASKDHFCSQIKTNETISWFSRGFDVFIVSKLTFAYVRTAMQWLDYSYYQSTKRSSPVQWAGIPFTQGRYTSRF
jgi:hypothetical protein